jgi:hypothetical protein
LCICWLIADWDRPTCLAARLKSELLGGDERAQHVHVEVEERHTSEFMNF